MCRHIHIRIAPEEKRAALRLTGVLLPVYASIALLLLTVAMVFHRPPNERLAAGTVPASQHAQLPR